MWWCCAVAVLLRRAVCECQFTTPISTQQGGFCSHGRAKCFQQQLSMAWRWNVWPEAVHMATWCAQWLMAYSSCCKAVGLKQSSHSSIRSATLSYSWGLGVSFPYLYWLLQSSLSPKLHYWHGSLFFKSGPNNFCQQQKEIPTSSVQPRQQPEPDLSE